MPDGNFMPPEVSAALLKMTQDVQNAMTAVKESKSEDTDKNLEKFFAKYEDLNAVHAKNYALWQKNLADHQDAIAAAEKAASEAGTKSTEMDKRINDLVMTLATKGNAKTEVDERGTEHYKGFWDLVKKNIKPTSGGQWAFRPEVPAEIKALRTDSDQQGGYLIPQVMDNEIRKNITEMSPVRMHARVRVSPNKTMEIPRRHTIPTATFEGEGDAASNSQSTYGSEQITLWRQTLKVPATLDMMVSSAFDLEREIAADVGEAYGYGEGYNFVKGTGIKCPQGFTTDARCEVVTSVGSGALIWDDMIEIAGKLKRGQNPWYYMNRRTLAYMQKLKSTIGVPIWAPVSGSTPATIWGFPYSSDMIDLDEAQSGSNAKPVVFADLRRGYEIYDMLGISVVRDDLTMADKAITQWIFRRYLTGQVVIPEAIKILKIQ